jgi:hypothetical protein
MAQCEHYEVWILDVGDWMLKSSWRDLEVGLAAARALPGPVRIIRAVFDGEGAVERNVVVELGAPQSQPAGLSDSK